MPDCAATFCPTDVDDLFATVDWEVRSAQIKGENGELIFEQTNCEVPSFWSQLATNDTTRSVTAVRPSTHGSVALTSYSSPRSSRASGIRIGRSVAVIAVDPSSPYSGGALLGDRVRMQGHATVAAEVADLWPVGEKPARKMERAS